MKVSFRSMKTWLPAIDLFNKFWFAPASAFSRWFPVVLYAGFIFFLSSRSALPAEVSAFPDKLAHAILYAVLGALAARALTKPAGLSKMSRGILAILLATAYGVSDEWHQSFVPHRTMEIADVAADFVGAAVGAVTYFLIAGRFAYTTTHISGR